jgi:hypothetical protein
MYVVLGILLILSGVLLDLYIVREYKITRYLCKELVVASFALDLLGVTAIVVGS